VQLLRAAAEPADWPDTLPHELLTLLPSLNPPVVQPDRVP